MEYLSKIYGFLKETVGNIYDQIVKGFNYLLLKTDIQFILNQLWEFIQDSFNMVVNKIIAAISLIINSVVSIMPNFVLPSINDTIPTYIIETINWVIPVDFLIQCIGVITLSTVAYFTVGIVLRWAKVAA